MPKPILSDSDLAWLNQTFERNRERFSGWRMEAEPADGAQAPDVDGGSDPDPADDALGDAGKKALDKERVARKKAEGDLSALRSEFDTFRSALGEAFGVQPGKTDDSDTLATVQQQLSALQHESLVYRLAAEHSITDSGDLDLLKAATAEHAPKLAERLAAKADGAQPGNPKPDASQGPKGDPAKSDPGPGLPRLAAAYAASESSGTT